MHASTSEMSYITHGICRSCTPDEPLCWQQASTGAVFGSFEVKVDMMSALKFSASDITRLYNATQNTTEGALPRVVSAVVFRWASPLATGTAPAYRLAVEPSLAC